MILTAKELRELTLRQRPAAQARILANMGIPFHVHPIDGVLLVARSAVAAKLGTADVTTSVDTPPEYEVNTQEINRHGKTSRSR